MLVASFAELIEKIDKTAKIPFSLSSVCVLECTFASMYLTFF